MQIRLIVVGKTKANFIKEGERFYLQRLLPFCQVDYIVVKSFASIKGQNQNTIKDREGKEILAKISQNDLVVVWDEQGKLLSSVDFAQQLNQLVVDRGKITMIIGGAFGLSREVKDRANFVFSLSPLTFTHEMARLLVLEQLYRAMTIIKGVPYHY